jgi:dinuclear metal center YbgI/SA1388 family protein
MLLEKIIDVIEKLAPIPFQESYDNSGLIIGSPQQDISSAIIALDITGEVVDEAIQKKCNLIISHHPLIFNGIKKLLYESATERLIAKVIKHDIAIYSAHTNLDNVAQGVNAILCRKLGIMNPRILRPSGDLLKKLVTFCPRSHVEKVREALSAAGAGIIGNYDSCSFSVEGSGTFRPLEGSSPFVGNKGELHYEKEVRIEMIFPSHLLSYIIKALLHSHPYEEVAYDILPLANTHPYVGAGMIGNLETPTDELKYLNFVKKTLGIGCIRHSPPLNREISRIAVCGGSGGFLISESIACGADLFLTGDIRYHDFFIPEGRMMIADIGHYESEQFTKELILAVLQENFPNFAIQISETGMNPVNYL